MDYNERNGSYSDDELLSRFFAPGDAAHDRAGRYPGRPGRASPRPRPRPGIRMASGRPMRGMKSSARQDAKAA